MSFNQIAPFIMILNLKKMKPWATCCLVSGLLALALPAFAQPAKNAKVDASKPIDSDGDGLVDDKDGCPKQKGDTTCLGCPCKPTSIPVVKLPEFVAAAEKTAAPAPKKGKGKGKKRAEAAAPEPTFDENFIKALNEIIALAPEKFIAQHGAEIGKGGTTWEANVSLPEQGRAIIYAKTVPNPSFQAYFAENVKTTKEEADVTFNRLRDMLMESYKDWTMVDKSNKKIAHWLVFTSPNKVEIQLKMQNTPYGSKSDPNKFDILVSIMQQN